MFRIFAVAVDIVTVVKPDIKRVILYFMQNK